MYNEYLKQKKKYNISESNYLSMLDLLVQISFNLKEFRKRCDLHGITDIDKLIFIKTTMVSFTLDDGEIIDDASLKEYTKEEISQILNKVSECKVVDFENQIVYIASSLTNEVF